MVNSVSKCIYFNMPIEDMCIWVTSFLHIAESVVFTVYCYVSMLLFLSKEIIIVVWYSRKIKRKLFSPEYGIF